MYTVLLFSPKYPPSRGGAATFYSNLLSTTNDEVRYFVLTEYRPEQSIATHEEDLSVYRLLPRISFLHKYIRALLEIILILAISVYILLKEDIDLIHAHASSFSVISLAAVSATFQIPLIYDCRDEGFRPWLIQMGHTPVWFSCSSNIDEKLTRNGIPADQIVRLPVVNPDYVREYRSVPDSQKVTDLLYIGSLREAKGIFLLLESFKRIHDRGFDLNLTVIGDGPAQNEFERHCVEFGVRENITLTGSLSHNETLHRLADSDILILPSQSEGLPRVVLEGQDVGTPVVATSVGGIPDVINHEENGMLAEQTPESVIENVLLLVHNDSLYRTIAKNGIECADKRDWESVRKQLYMGYERTV